MANRRFIDFPIAASVGNNDIVLIWQDGLNKQTTKATLLQGSPQSLAGLTDVDISALNNGQILQYNSTISKWENVDRTDINLSQLGDVTIVAPANGQVLVYNSSTGKWENSSAGYVPYTGAVTTVNLGAQSILAGSFVKAGGTAAQFLKANGSVDSTVYGTGTVTSVALTMPSAFSVSGSPITNAGTLAVTGAGTVGQYIRGDGSLADFPATTGGGSSVSYYLNSSVSQGTIGGVVYRELNRAPIFGAGTDITTSSNGYIANFITDAGDPNKLLIPAGNWNLETYFSASNGGGSPTFYVELYKYNGTTFTLIATSSGTPELIAFGTNINPYFTTLAVPETVLALTDRLALRYYVNTSGRTITLHTENGHLCQVITTFTTGLTALNGLTNQVQFFAVGTSGTDFAISSATDTHTFNLPTASATNRGALSSADWTTFNGKQNALTNPVTGTGTSGTLPKFTGSTTIGNSLFTENGTHGAFGGANYSGGTDVRSFNISAPLYAGLGFYANNQYAADIFGYGVTGNLFLSSDPTNIFNGSKIVFLIDGTEKVGIFSNGNVSIDNSPTDQSVKLYVNGTGRFSGALTGTTATFGSTGTGNNVIAISNNDQSNVRLRITNTGAGGRTYSIVGGLNAANNSSFSIFDETAASTRFDISSTGAATFSSSVNSVGLISSSTVRPSSNFAADLGTSSFRWADIFGYALNLSGGTTVSTRLTIARGSDDSSQNLLLGWNTLTVQRTSVPLSSPQTDFSIIQQGSNGSRTPLYISSSGAATFIDNVTAGQFLSFVHTAQGAGANGISDGPFFRYVNTTNSYQILKQINANTDEDTWTIRGGGWNKVGNLNAVTGVYTPLSDKNKKKDFEKSTIGLNAILGLKPTLYRMKDQEETETKQLGFIAQEVKEYIPQAYVEQENFIGLQDRPIIAALVKAIQEQQEIINYLKEKIQ